MNPFNLEQDFNAEHLEEQELNFNTVFEDFLNETDTANDHFDFIIQGQEDTITHIIQLDWFNELNNLNGFNINYDFYRNNDRLTLEELEQEPEPELDDLLQYILDDDDDVIPYDCPMEAGAFYAD